jgi:hypothetical protein
MQALIAFAIIVLSPYITQGPPSPEPAPPKISISQLTIKLNTLAKPYTTWRTDAQRDSNAARLKKLLNAQARIFTLENRAELANTTWKDGWATLQLKTPKRATDNSPIYLSRPHNYKIPLTQQQAASLKPGTMVFFAATIELAPRFAPIDFPGTPGDPPTLYILHCNRPQTQLGQYIATAYTVSVGPHFYAYTIRPLLTPRDSK